MSREFQRPEWSEMGRRHLPGAKKAIPADPHRMEMPDAILHHRGRSPFRGRLRYGRP